MRLYLILLLLQLGLNVEVSFAQNVCSNLPTVPHAVVSGATTRVNYQEGHVIEFTCEPGFKSSQTPKYVCTSNGWLAVRQGTCFSCSTLPNVAHAVVSEETKKVDYQEGDMIQFTCDTNHTSGETIKYICTDEGWLPVMQGVCVSSGCDFLPDEGVTVIGLPEDKATISPGHVLTFRCDDPKTQLKGNPVLTCGTDGTWNYPFPSCEDITCQVPVMHRDLHVAGLTSANETVKIGGKLQFRCSPDYGLKGSKKTECLETGQWSAPFPTCVERCKITGIPDSVFVLSPYGISLVNMGQQLLFTCRNYRHSLHGEETVQCLADGKWSHPFPTCGAPLGCNTRPPALEHGRIMSFVRSYYKHNETVQYICQTFHVMEGDGYMKCVNGEWSGRMRCFKPCTVTREEMELRNIYFTFRPREPTLFSFHGGSLTFTCVPGTSHDGRVAMGPKCVDGVMTLPTCH